MKREIDNMLNLEMLILKRKGYKTIKRNGEYLIFKNNSLIRVLSKEELKQWLKMLRKLEII